MYIGQVAVTILAKNKKARRNYEISETLEAGIVLRGSEVKSMRESKAQIDEAFARFDKGELWLMGMNVAPYSSISTHVAMEPVRKRKLLLHKVELDRLFLRTEQQDLSLIPLALYLKDGKVKVEIGIGKGRKLVDKRQMIAKRDADREARRALSDRTKY